jgi:hypothetical protein
VDIQTIIDAVNKIPTLEEKIEELAKENRELIKSQKEVMSFQDVHLFFHNQYTNRRVREIMRKAGASEQGREIFVKRSDFERWYMANKIPCDLEAQRFAATYVMKKPLRKGNLTPALSQVRGE